MVGELVQYFRHLYTKPKADSLQSFPYLSSNVFHLCVLDVAVFMCNPCSFSGTNTNSTYTATETTPSFQDQQNIQLYLLTTHTYSKLNGKRTILMITQPCKEHYEATSHRTELQPKSEFNKTSSDQRA